jgi:RHS repeat-associated protein
MGAFEEAKEYLVESVGMWWPNGDEGKLRDAAQAWRDFADAVDDVNSVTDRSSRSLIHHNSGEAIEAFEIFWNRYHKKSEVGWLDNVSKAARAMAKGLDKLAEEIEGIKTKIDHRLEISAVVIAAGIGLAFFTAGLASGAAVAAATAMVDFAAGLGVTVSTTVATIAGTTLAGAAFGSLEAVTVDLAVAQPLSIGLGEQKGGLQLDQTVDAAKSGALFGGGFGAGAGGIRAVSEAGGLRLALNDIMLPQYSSIRPGALGELPAAARLPRAIKCDLDPIDVATGTMLLPQTDVTLPGQLPLVFERTHLSSYRAGGWFGRTWASPLDERLQLDDEGIVYAAADGMRLVYPIPRPGQPVFPVQGPRWPLTWSGAVDGDMTVTDPATGIARTFTRAAPTTTPGVVDLHLGWIENRTGSRIDLDRNVAGIPTAIRHTGGYYIAVDTDHARVTALRLLDQAPSAYEQSDSFGGTVIARYAYTDEGHLSEVYDSDGHPLCFTYDADGRITSWTDRNDTSYRYTYDEQGRVVRTDGTNGFLAGVLAYDEAQHTVTVTNSLGHRRVYQHDDAFEVIAETDPLGHTIRTERAPVTGKPTSVTDALGRTTRFSYDETGNLTRITLPDGSTGQASYNDLGCPVIVTQPGGATWRHTFDETGNCLSASDPTGAETHYAYDANGYLSTVTDALGHIRHITSNPAGLPLAVTDPLGHTTTVQRDAFGRIVDVTDPLGQLNRFGWTPEGKPAWRETPDGAREIWSWDGEGNLLTHTDQLDQITQYTYGPFDVPVTRTDPDGTAYAFTYDTELRLTQVTNPQGLTWDYTYDEAGSLASETDFNDRAVHYTYDAARQLVSRTNGVGETLTFRRDIRGRISTSVTDSGAEVTFTYSPSGDLIRAVNPDTECTREYDALARLLSETVDGRTTAYTFDPLGRRTSRTTPTGLTSQWTYDEAGRPLSLSSDAGTLTFTHDDAGREVERRLGAKVRLAQSWDAADRLTIQSLTCHRDQAPGAELLLAHRDYVYRADSSLAEIRELATGTRHIELSSTGRITSITAHNWRETYAYDGSGNLTHATTALGHPTDGDREFTGTLLHRAGRNTYVHDAQGRLTRKTQKLLSGQKRTWTYTWNTEDRLTEVVTPGGETWRYIYDPLGRRTAKHRLGTDGTIVEQVTFIWDGTRLAEQTAVGGKITTWEYAHDSHRPLAQIIRPRLIEQLPSGIAALNISSTDAPRFHAVITDPTGTPTELVAPDGRIVWQHRTTLWGAPLPSPTPPDDQDGTDCLLRFPGQYADHETGFHYNLHRFYDPETARFISPDPLGLEPSPNNHAYVRNPLRWTDPTGLTPCIPTNEDAVPGIVFRSLSKGEDPAAGLTARSPESTEVTPLSHVAGKIKSPWISTTKLPETAFVKYGGNEHGVVAIDLSKISGRVEDVSGGFPGKGRIDIYAKKDQEVLIHQNIPADAIIGYWPPS